MTNAPELLWSCDAQVECGYGQMYIYSHAGLSPDAWGEDAGNDTSPSDNTDAWQLALEQAEKNNNYLGASKGLVDVLTADQYNSDIPMRIEVWTAEPASDIDDWHKEADVDMDIPDGQLVFEASGGGVEIPISVPPGQYRARVSGNGWDPAEKYSRSGSYRLRLWPRTEDSDLFCRKAD